MLVLQVVWKGTTRVGAAVATRKDKDSTNTYVVARYYPPGNVIGQFAQNVGWKVCWYISNVKQTCILLTKHEGCTGRISAQGHDNTDQAQRGPYRKDRGPIFPSTVPSKRGL